MSLTSQSDSVELHAGCMRLQAVVGVEQPGRPDSSWKLCDAGTNLDIAIFKDGRVIWMAAALIHC